MVYFNCPLGIEDVLKVVSDLEAELLWNVLPDQELIHVSHLLLVLCCIHVVS